MVLLVMCLGDMLLAVAQNKLSFCLHVHHSFQMVPSGRVGAHAKVGGALP